MRSFDSQFTSGTNVITTGIACNRTLVEYPETSLMLQQRLWEWCALTTRGGTGFLYHFGDRCVAYGGSLVSRRL